MLSLGTMKLKKIIGEPIELAQEFRTLLMKCLGNIKNFLCF